jgi:hypothetical protein
MVASTPSFAGHHAARLRRAAARESLLEADAWGEVTREGRAYLTDRFGSTVEVAG